MVDFIKLYSDEELKELKRQYKVPRVVLEGKYRVLNLREIQNER